MAIEYVPGESFLHRLDPRVKFILVASLTYITISLNDPMFLLILIASIYITSYACKLPFNIINAPIKSVSPVFIIYFLFNLWLNPVCTEATKIEQNILFYLVPFANFIPVTLQGLVYSLACVLKFALIILIFRIFTMITPVMHMILGLVKLKLPPAAGVAFSIGFGFIPVLTRAIRVIEEAQQCRGWKGLRCGNLVDKIKALPPLLVPTLLYTLTSAQKVAVAIEARGFGYNIKARTYRRKLQLSRIDYIGATILIALTIIIQILILSGYGGYQWTVSLLTGKAA